MKLIRRYTCNLCGDIFYNKWETFEHFQGEHPSTAEEINTIDDIIDFVKVTIKGLK